MARHAFVSYVRESAALADRLAKDLATRGVTVWLDRERIMPGQRWRDAIREAIRAGDLFIACFSSAYEARASAYMNEELTLAIEELRRRPTSRAWFIPVSLDGASIPSRSIGAGETLTDLQWVDLSVHWDRGVKKIAEAAEAIDDALDDPWHAVAARAAKAARDRAARERWQEFLWSPGGVAAANAELKNLYDTLRSMSTELVATAAHLHVEFEASGPSCAVRMGRNSVVLTWLIKAINEVEHARLYMLEYDWPYHLNRPDPPPREPRASPYRFANEDDVYGWSTEAGTFVRSHELAVTCIDRLVSKAEHGT